MPVIGLLAGAQLDSDSVMAEFRRGLREAGYVEGSNLAIDVRLAEGHYDRLPALAAELVRRPVAAIAAITPVAALAAKAATTSIPIVFLLGSDPAKDGLVASLNRPGGNVTGITFFTNLLVSKRLQSLHELVPNAGRIGLLINPGNANADLELGETQMAAQALGVELVVERAAAEHEIDAAFAGFARGLGAHTVLGLARARVGLSMRPLQPRCHAVASRLTKGASSRGLLLGLGWKAIGKTCLALPPPIRRSFAADQRASADFHRSRAGAVLE
jgi:putative ABC transport system substrate-binding protein